MPIAVLYKGKKCQKSSKSLSKQTEEVICTDFIGYLVEKLLWHDPTWDANVFSSPEPKAQVSFSDQNLSVVRRRRCRCRRRRCRKLFTFSSSSPEPLGQFQPNLAQSILGWMGFKFVQMKGSALFQGEIITK